MNRKLSAIPAYLLLIAANALPVIGAATGKLVFFQVLYLYWFESLLLIIFDCIRIATAQGSYAGGSFFQRMECAPPVRGIFPRLWLIVRTIVGRVLLLLFYLVFLILFVGFQVTGEGHTRDILETMIFRNEFFNTSVAVFLINMAVQLIGGFFISGKFRTDSPYSYTYIFDRRTIMIHVMLISSVFIHQFFFEDKSYEATGEIVYIGIFMLVKTVVDVIYLRSRFAEQPGDIVMI